MHKLTVEEWKANDGDHLNGDRKSLEQGELFHALPYFPDVLNVQLTSRIRSYSGAGGEGARTPDRPHLVVGSFGARGAQSDAGRLRTALLRQCENHPAECSIRSLNATGPFMNDILQLYNQSVRTTHCRLGVSAKDRVLRVLLLPSLTLTLTLTNPGLHASHASRAPGSHPSGVYLRLTGSYGVEVPQPSTPTQPRRRSAMCMAWRTRIDT